MSAPMAGDIRTADGARLVYFEWGERTDETVLLVHATGFHARCWDQVVEHLLGRHVISVDLRGHGRSDKLPPYGWDRFGRDLVELADSLDLCEIVGVGHSMGGHSMTQAAAHVPDRFRRLVLVDPVIMARESYRARQWTPAGEEHPVARRRNHFANWQEMMERLADRGSYPRWKPEVLEDYCRYGLLPDPDGAGFVLACPPQVEASIYMGSTSVDIYDLIAQIEIPVTVARAKPRTGRREGMDFALSATWPELASKFRRGRDVYWPDLTHFMPMQAPERVAQLIVEGGD